MLSDLPRRKPEDVAMRTLKEIWSRDEERQDLRTIGLCYVLVLAIILVFFFAMLFIEPDSAPQRTDLTQAPRQTSVAVRKRMLRTYSNNCLWMIFRSIGHNPRTGSPAPHLLQTQYRMGSAFSSVDGGSEGRVCPRGPYCGPYFVGAWVKSVRCGAKSGSI